MTYYANMQNQQPLTSFSGSVQSVFQPGFAGTNVQEVRALNHGGFAPAVSGTYGAPIQASFGMGGANAIFQPGFAGTNVQEVRQQNAGYSSPAIAGTSFGMQMQTPYQGQPYGGVAQSVFSPGFAGTNVEEVRARNSNTYAGYSGGLASGIFSPGFAGTNVQEVRALNTGYPAPSVAGGAYGAQQQYAQQQQQYAQQQLHAQQQQYAQQQYAQQQFTPQQYTSPIAGGVNAVYQPNFAGTNVAEVRALNAGQSAPQSGSIFQSSI